MEKAAVDKAKVRLEAARQAFASLVSSKSYKEAELAWYQFLVPANAVFGVLEQAAKVGDAEWYKERRSQRYSDPLLCYLRAARNAEEHRTPSVTEVDRQKMVMIADGKPVAALENMTGNRGTYRTANGEKFADLSKITEMRIYPERAKLVRVTDDSGTFDPPVEHLGQPIEDNSPIEVARLMLAYVDAMTRDAEYLIR